MVPISPSNWLWLAGAGFFPGFLAIYLAVVALDKLPAATFGTLAYLEPIFVVFLGWVLFGEHLNSLQLAGCALILASGIVKGYLAGRPARPLR
jgi:drug/metabolite transporter (DMT)-like permease